MNFNSTTPNKLEQQAKQLIEGSQFNSIEWRLTQNKTQLSSGFVANSSAPTIASPIYRIYSMTKPVVSLVTMQLIEENKLQLSDNVSQYIPAMASLQVLNANGKLEKLSTPITVEHLLTHTAGFSYDFLPDCSVATQYREVELSGRGDRALAEVIGLLTTMPLAFQPGSQWRYSVATDVLAHVLENVTSCALPELLNDRVFSPLGMNDTAFHVQADKIDRLLPMFGARELGDVMVESDAPNTLNALDVEAGYPSNENSGFYRGGHGLFSTLADYQKFLHVLQTGESLEGQRLIAQETFDLMWRNRIDDALKPLVLGFNTLGGYGWNLMGRIMQDPAQCEFKTVEGEGGWAGAASTYFWVDRTNNISGIAMSQYIGSNPHLGALMQHAAYGMFAD